MSRLIPYCRFSSEEKRELFEFIVDIGIPINQEGKPNWGEIREKFYAYNSKYDAKSVNLIEKIVQEFRMICQQIIQRHNYSQKVSAEEASRFKVSPTSLDVSPEEAEQFYHHTNLLKFIRKTILFNDRQLFKTYQDEYLEEVAALAPENPAYIGNQGYKPEVQDLTLLLFLSENGFNRLDEIKNDPVYGFNKLGLTEEKLLARIAFICDFFKAQLDKTSRISVICRGSQEEEDRQDNPGRN
jgi:hypothetical protein